MHAMNFLAASGALLSVVAAVPMAKRDIEWVTQTDEVIVTVPVTTTVWVDAAEATPTTKAHFPHGHHHNDPVTSTVQSTVVVQQSSAAAPVQSSQAAPAPSSQAPAPSSQAPAPSSAYVAPTTSQYVAPAPAPTTSSQAPAYTPPASSSSASPPSSGSSGPSTGAGAAGKSYTGDLTYYDVGLGACGITSSPDQSIVAISHVIFDQYTPNGNPNKNPLCGKTVSIKGKDGSSHDATIVDRCPGCAQADLDMTETLFNKVTNNGDGRVHGMTWTIQ